MATTDILDIDEAKAFIGRKGDMANARLATRITAISQRLDNACGAIVVRTITGEAHSGGEWGIRLNHPATAFTTVTEYQGTTAVVLTRETIGTQPSDGYYAEPYGPDPSIFSGVLSRRSGGSDIGFYWGRANVAVTYTAGRYATTAAVAPVFKEAALTMLEVWAQSDPGVVTQGDFQVPGRQGPWPDMLAAAKQILGQHWREIPGVG